MGQKVREIACPDLLRQRLRAFSAKTGGNQIYLVTDPLQKRTLQLEPWQFFVLEVVTACKDLTRLSLLVEDRYGQPITREDLDSLFTLIADRSWFAASAPANSLVADFNRRRPAPLTGTEQDQSRPLPDSALDPALLAAVQHALALDTHMRGKIYGLFDPNRALQLIYPLLLPCRRLVYLTPLLLLPALFVACRYYPQFSDDLLNWFGRISFAWHALFGLATVNFLATWVSALVAYHYAVPVGEFCILFYFVVYPRFTVRLGDAGHLPRRARIWFHAAPLVLRLIIFSIVTLVWFHNRHAENLVAQFCLAVSVMCQVSFLMTVNPLRKSNGYWLLAALTNEPSLREKAITTLSDRLRGRVAKSTDALLVYALASILFIIAGTVVFLYLLGRFLQSHLSGVGVLVVVGVSAVLLFRMVGRFKKFGLTDSRAAQFKKWRDRNIPDDVR